MKTKIEFYMNGSEVVRYHTVHTLQRETVGHHSHGVAMLCHILNPECQKFVLVAALQHDLAEHQTGDIPSPAKRQYGIGEQVSELEDKLLKIAGLEMPGLTNEEIRLLKLADIAQGALFCSREISLGNARMRDIFDRYMSYANQMLLVGREKDLFNIIKESVK
jgi:5'-deoxynucleotidase YfbR-like HD superfamily hydrolase